MTPPAFGHKYPPINLSKVVFPEPLGPRIAQCSFCATVQLMESRMNFPSAAYETSRTSTAGVFFIGIRSADESGRKPCGFQPARGGQNGVNHATGIAPRSYGLKRENT